MADPINLADPAFEPSGEQLQGLASRACAGVRAAREARQERIRLQIARQREIALQHLAEVGAARAEPSA